MLARKLEKVGNWPSSNGRGQKGSAGILKYVARQLVVVISMSSYVLVEMAAVGTKTRVLLPLRPGTSTSCSGRGHKPAHGTVKLVARQPVAVIWIF